MMLLLLFSEGIDGSFIGVCRSFTTILLRVVEERIPYLVFTDCQ